MKIIVAVLFSLVAYSAIAQADHEIVAKGDNVIIMETSITGDSSFMACSKYLVGKGYVFQSRDQSLGQIVSSPEN